jgi:hypothetical protein
MMMQDPSARDSRMMMTRSPGFTTFLMSKKTAKSPSAQERGCEREEVFV